MIDPLLALIGASAVLGVLLIVHAQLNDRREKRHKKWRRKQKLAEKRVELVFDEDGSAKGDDLPIPTRDESDSPRVEVEGVDPVAHAGHDPAKCRLCQEGPAL